MIEEKAFAKVNLFINVLSQRKDGYHDLQMINAKINLFDTIRIEKIPTPGLALIVSNDLFLSNQNNVVHDVASEILRAYAPEEGVRITIEKNIPFGAGLAGNSADAAAIIKGMSKLLSLNLNESEMAEIGLRFGADIPYCLVDHPALVEGVGEKITKLDIDWKPWKILLFNPKVYVSTQAVFDLGNKAGFANTDIAPVLQALADKNITSFASLLANAFEPLVADNYEDVKNARDLLAERLGKTNLVMTGTGSTFVKMIPETEAGVTNFIAEFGEKYFVGLYDFL